MRTNNVFTLALLVALLSSCGTMPRHSGGEASLSKDESRLRKATISKLHYDLEFFLDAKSEKFRGKSIATFQWTGSPAHSFIDFAGGTVTRLKINNKVAEVEQDKVRIYLKKNYLKEGANRIEIDFEQNYSNDGQGLTRSLDTKDNRSYIYSNLQPFGANKVFPNFDQPNLRASYKMKVIVPTDWEVVTYANVEKIENLADKKKLWIFPKSASYSTYIWALHAGPYKKWEAKNARIPMKLFVRQSLAPFVKPEFWFKITQQGFDFFEEYFATPYPYTKYDQILVPDFPAGAMENVGAVTFSERYVVRGKASRALLRDNANVILHELAHMWFGNLVTMDWWNDLWLNESFATFMATLAQSKNTEFRGQEAWRDFYGTKSWAYGEDDAVTTHPIEAPVETTLDAFTNFDGITYGKGASLLKQLNFYLGDESFKKGVQLYFQKYAGKNTKLSDFIASLEEGAGKNLQGWKQSWLQTSGVNRVSSELLCNENELNSVKLSQRVPLRGDKVLRSQRTKLAPYHLNGKNLLLGQSTNALIEGPFSLSTAKENTKCPRFLDSNHEDHAYFLPVYGQAQVEFFLNNYEAFKNYPFLRQRAWDAIGFMVYEGDVSLLAFSKALVRAVESENDPVILESLIYATAGYRDSSPSFIRAFPKNSTEEYDVFKSFVRALESGLWNALAKAPARSEIQKQRFRAFKNIVYTEQGAQKALSLLSGKVKLRGLEIDQDKRWDLLHAAARGGAPNSIELIDAELKKDDSNRAKRAALSAKTAYGDAEFIAEVFKKVKNLEDPMSYSDLRAFSTSLFSASQEKRRADYADKFFELMKELESKMESRNLQRLVDIAPSGCRPENLKKLKNFLNSNSLPPTVEKAMKKRIHFGEKCQTVKQSF